MASRILPAVALGAAFLSGCTVTSVGPEEGPPRVESDGLIEGHAAFGFRDEDQFLKLRVLEGESDGAVGELVLWKIFRLEVGALGLGVGIGPLDLALGTLFYEPEVPEMHGEERLGPPETEYVEPDCDICAAALAAEAAAAVP